MPNLKSAAFKDYHTVGDAEPRRIEPTGILHFTIGVTDLEKSRTFYETVLGCSYWRQNQDTVFMRAGDDYFVLSRTGYHQPPNNSGDTLIHHAFMVVGEDFDAAMAHLEASGVDILLYEDQNAGHFSFPGRHAYFHDPDGNCIEIIDLHAVGDAEAPTEEDRQGRKPKSHLGTA
jgi:catechol 2,3-dioxygenase-like lactoylglutathione lyase family enzyme